jgi:endonuclease/exonuclease/phosphatase family metal-dependent hydrolase
MKKSSRQWFTLRLLSAVMLLQLSAGISSTVRIATYNILDFPQSFGFQRLDDFRTALGYVDPDILIVQEMQSQSGVDLFLDSVMLPIHASFASAPFHDGPDTDNALFYRQDRIEYIGAQYLATTNRDIGAYRLVLDSGQSELYLFSVHLKASEGASNENIRLQETTTLRNYLSTLPGATDFLVAGDFNIYYSNEPAFRMMTDSLTNNNGRLFDPLHVTGNWHENSNYSAVHSQSTRVDQLPDGGAGGGLDDRFDMILCSGSLLDSVGLLLVQNSYTICGNDGEHFNLSVNYGTNNAVPSYVADALYFASDHLPLFVDLSLDTTPTMNERIVKVYPNPMRNWVQVTFPPYDDFVSARLTMTNILGQRVYEEETTDPDGYRIERENLPLGVYFLQIRIQTRFSSYDHRISIAIVK